MNNDEKVLSVLSDLSTALCDIRQEFNQRFDKLESGQAKLESGQAKLESGQAKLEAGQAKLEAGQAKLESDLAAVAKDVKEIREQTEHLTEVSAEIRLSLNDLTGVTKINTFDIATLRSKVS